jgi:hypothetical protein
MPPVQSTSQTRRRSCFLPNLLSYFSRSSAVHHVHGYDRRCGSTLCSCFFVAIEVILFYLEPALQPALFLLLAW